MVVTVFGLGFVGLTTALGFAEVGVKVYGVDANPVRSAEISSGKVPFLEPELDHILTRHLGKQFIVTGDIATAVAESDCIFYCVGTPYGENGEADLTYLYKAIAGTLSVIGDQKFRVLTIKSTVPPSTTKEKVVPFVKGLMPEGQIGIANNPEFLREGHCWKDFIHADRIVLGVEDKKSEDILRKLYSGFACPIFTVSLNTGEYIKYLSNTLLATMISYSNEMAEAAHVIGDIQIADAFKILHLDGRWGGCDMTGYVYPGCGYGGYCLPKDTNALYALMNNCGIEMPILGAVIRTNEGMTDVICKRIAGMLSPSSHIGILGLAFKPGSDDVRDSTAAKIIQGLIAKGYTNISAYDPAALENFQACYAFPQVKYVSSLEDISHDADVFVILTAWEEFRRVTDTGKKIIDCRYMI